MLGLHAVIRIHCLHMITPYELTAMLSNTEKLPSSIYRLHLFETFMPCMLHAHWTNRSLSLHRNVGALDGDSLASCEEKIYAKRDGIRVSGCEVVEAAQGELPCLGEEGFNIPSSGSLAV